MSLRTIIADDINYGWGGGRRPSGQGNRIINRAGSNEVSYRNPYIYSAAAVEWSNFDAANDPTKADSKPLYGDNILKVWNWL